MFSEPKGILYPNIQKPLYVQLRDIIVDLIESDELSPGDVLPGERVLAEMYDVSRVTVRKCIDSLVDEGYIIRSQGKQNTIVKKRMTHNLGLLVGIVEELFNTKGIIVTVEVIRKEYETASSVVRKHLKLIDTNRANVYSFSRVLKRNGQPLAINHSYVPYDIGKIVDSLDLTKDKVFAHMENCGYNLSYGEQEITSGLCTKEEAGYLNYKVGQPVLVIKRTTFLENGYPILYEKTIFRGLDYQYSIRLQRKMK